MKTTKLAHTFGLATRLALAPLAGVSFVALTTGTLAGCADENDPKTWVKRLDDPAQRPQAVKRLQAFFEDGLRKADNNRDDPKFKALLDDIVEPLTKQYTAGNIPDEKTRKELIKFLADTSDPRTAPALAKALNDYEPKKSEEDVKAAALATKNLANAGKLTDQPLIDALWSCFSKFRASQTQSIQLVTALHDAVLAVKHPSYGPKAVEKLASPVDMKSPESQRDHIQFWQLTSVQLIGELKYGPAAKALVVMLLTPSKADLRAPVRTALLKMPKEAEGPLIAAMRGTDPEFAKLAADYPDKAHVAVLAESLSYLSRPATRDAMLEALAAADNDQNRTVLAMHLIHFPTEQKIVDAYLAAYGKVAAAAAIPLMGGANGRAILVQTASHFYDPKLTDWVLKEKASAKGVDADAMTPAAFDAATKLMTVEQVKAVGAAVGRIDGPATEKDKYNAASKVTDRCKADAACYVKYLDEPIPSSPETAKMGAIKACWMAAILGNEQTRKDLIGKVDKIKDGSVRLTLVEAIDHLSPKGDVSGAEVLEKIVEADKASGNKLLLQSDDAVAKTALKLRSRAAQ